MLCRVREGRETDNASPATSLQDDLNETLFGEFTPSPAHQRRKTSTKTTVDAQDVTVRMGMCPLAPERTLVVSAVVLDDAVLVCRWSSGSGEWSHLLLRSTGTVQVPTSGGRGSVSVPSLVGAQQLEDVVISTPSSTEDIRPGCGVGYRPVLSLLQSDTHSITTPCNTITSELFLCLFGLEFEVAKTPVVLIGCQNGNIYFTNGKSHGGRLMPLYSMEQPVVGLHSVYFPSQRDPKDRDPFLIRQEADQQDAIGGTHNSLLFLGQRGKVTVCHVGTGVCPSPGFVEFHVPSPILSLVLVPSQCLLYSTLQGLYKICLRESCAECVEEKVPPSGKLPIRVPQTSFKFPERVWDSRCVCYLLQTTASGDGLGISVDGRLFAFKFGPLGTTPCVKRSSAQLVGQEIKSTLQAVQEQGERVEGVREEMRSLNNLLAELKSALEMLCSSVATSGSGPDLLGPGGSGQEPAFFCQFRCTCEDVATQLVRLGIRVDLAYNAHSGSQKRGVALGEGWSLIAVFVSGGGGIISKSVSLSGLLPGDSVTLRVHLDSSGHGGRGGQLSGALHCFLHYDPLHLSACFKSSRKSQVSSGISLFLTKKSFDILDFLLPHGHSREVMSSLPLKTLHTILSSENKDTPSQPSPPPLLHTTSFRTGLRTAITMIQCWSHTTEELWELTVGTIASKLLGLLVPHVSVGARGEMVGGLDGESVELRLSDSTSAAVRASECAPDTMLWLEVCASSRGFLARVVSAVNTRLKAEEGEGQEGEEYLSHEEGCVRLARLEQLLEEVRETEREIAAAKHQTRTNLISSEAHHKTLQSWETRTLALYTKLREHPL